MMQNTEGKIRAFLEAERIKEGRSEDFKEGFDLGAAWLGEYITRELVEEIAKVRVKPNDLRG